MFARMEESLSFLKYIVRIFFKCIYGFCEGLIENFLICQFSSIKKTFSRAILDSIKFSGSKWMSHFYSKCTNKTTTHQSSVIFNQENIRKSERNSEENNFLRKASH